MYVVPEVAILNIFGYNEYATVGLGCAGETKV